MIDIKLPHFVVLNTAEAYFKESFVVEILIYFAEVKPILGNR